MSLLTRHPDGLRLTEIKDGLELPASSVHNLIQTMVAAEMLTATEDQRYTIGPRAVVMALSVVGSLDVRASGKRYLQDLARTIGDDVYLGMKIGKRVLYVDRCPGTHRVALDIRIGESLHLHATATGKLFSAFDKTLAAYAVKTPLARLTDATITSRRALAVELERIRDQGFAKSAEEAVHGVVGYAFPIKDASNALAAAVHVSVSSNRVTPAHERSIIEASLACATLIARTLGCNVAAARQQA